MHSLLLEKHAVRGYAYLEAENPTEMQFFTNEFAAYTVFARFSKKYPKVDLVDVKKDRVIEKSTRKRR